MCGCVCVLLIFLLLDFSEVDTRRSDKTARAARSRLAADTHRRDVEVKEKNKTRHLTISFLEKKMMMKREKKKRREEEGRHDHWLPLETESAWQLNEKARPL